jgi:hypothetical protein
MFVGTTPPEVRLLLNEILSKRKGQNVYIGCSGNFTVDKIAAFHGCKVHSNDVSLYSRTVADILLGRDHEVKVNDPLFEGVFSQWQESRYKNLIQILYIIKISGFRAQKNDYQKTFFKYYIDQANEFHTQTVEKFERTQSLNFKIADFFYGDFVDHIKEKQGKGIGILFPPTYKGGYEKLFQFIDETFSYEPAPYKLFDPKGAGTLFQGMLEGDENIIYSDREFPNLSEYVIAKVRLGKSRHDIFIYSSVDRDTKFYLEKQVTKPVKPYPMMPYDFKFTPDTKLSVRFGKADEVNYYKGFFMAAKVDYSLGGDLGLLFFADDKLFGFACFSKFLSTQQSAFIHSDFVVSASEKQLSKLVIMLLLSKEVREELVDGYKNYFDKVKTTVYTDKPVSMKYRGVLKLERRDKGKLIYEGEFKNATIKDIFIAWMKRKKSNSSEGNSKT